MKQNDKFTKSISAYIYHYYLLANI